jgi:phosphocarrier protein HPr
MSPDTPPEERASLEIRNKLGLHARAAKLFIDTVDPFNAEIMVTKDGQTVNGRSIMGLMMLAAEQGSRIDVVSKGPQAVEALDAVRALLDARFNESE